MDYNARLRRIENVINGLPQDENIIVLYDAAAVAAYQPQPNDFIIIADYGEGFDDQLKPNKIH